MNSKLKFCTQTAVVALLIGAGAAPAFAQDQGQIETVVVSGFRASLASALEAKQNSSLIMESVVAEDIGKMPDQDVAESLQRLPGVQINRDQGKGSTVLINGLRQNLDHAQRRCLSDRQGILHLWRSLGRRRRRQHPVRLSVEAFRAKKSAASTSTRARTRP